MSTWALVAGIVTTAWAVADVTSIIRAPPLAIGEAGSPLPARRPVTPQDYGTAIGAAHLLGQESPPIAPKAGPGHPTHLELLGVHRIGSRDGFAFIRADGHQEVYRLGTSLPGGQRLGEIHAGHVVLEGNLGSERLSLAEFSAQGAATGVLVTERVASLRARAVADPLGLAKMIEAQPYRRDGVIYGYRLQTRQDMPLLEEMGLKEGDILLEVNGVRLDGPGKGLKVLHRLARAEEITARIERHDRTLTVSHQIN